MCEEKTLTEKIEEARYFCTPFLGQFACSTLSGNEVINLQRTLQHYQMTIQQRDDKIDKLQKQLKDSVQSATGNYFYLGQPYSSPDPEVQHERARYAMKAVAKLLNSGVHVFSPILHCHELAHAHDLPKDYSFWKDYALAMLTGSRGIIVLQLPGWKDSVGLSDELAYSQTLPHHAEPLYMGWADLK